MRRPRRDPLAFHADLETVAYADGTTVTTVILRLDDEIIRYANFTDWAEAYAFAHRAKFRVSRGRGLVTARADSGNSATYYVDEERKG